MHCQAIPDDGLFERLLNSALTGLKYYARSGELQRPAVYRLAFREFGLAIGMRAILRMWQEVSGSHVVFSAKREALLKALMRYAPLGDDIESFWLQGENQNAETWTEHRDINEVMLATCLSPDGFLVLLPFH